MKALTTPFPANRLRTIASAQTIPKTVFTGTAIAVMISVSLKAWIVSGVVSAFQAEPKPSSNVRQKTIASGPTQDHGRYPERDEPRVHAIPLARSCLVVKKGG